MSSPRPSRRRPAAIPAGLGVLSLLLAGCGGGTDSAADAEEQLTIVTSTDVYASLAEHVVDGAAEVETLVDDAATDPHSYEATPQDRLSVEQADVLIANGGGYDSFLTQLASSAEKDEAVIQVLDGPNEHQHDDAHAGHDHDEALEGNEHVWYDLPMMRDFVLDLGERLGEQAPEHAEEFTRNAEELAAEIDALDERALAIEADGTAYLATEPISGHLLARAGFEDLTDAQFLAAVEHGDDVSPRLYQQALETAGGDETDLLSYNAQTETGQSRRIREAAEQAGVPVLDFSETLPDDVDDYLEWMRQNLSRLEQVVEDHDG